MKIYAQLAWLIPIYNYLFGLRRKGAKVEITIGHMTIITGSKVYSQEGNNSIYVGNECRLRNVLFRFYGTNNKIVISEECKLTNAEFYLEGNNNTILLGKKTTVSGKTEFAALEGTDIIIGEDCMFAQNISVRTSDSHPIFAEKKRINFAENVMISNHVWIGTHVYILKGVTIGTGSIIGACSVVTKSLPHENCIYAGVPAKQVSGRDKHIYWKR